MKFGKRTFKSLAAIAIGACVVSCFSGRVSGMESKIFYDRLELFNQKTESCVPSLDARKLGLNKATFHERFKMFNDNAAFNERNDMRGVSYTDKCCVCLEPLRTHKDESDFGPKRLVCGHVIHRHCMMEMYDHRMFTCPLCRQKMNIKGKFIK